jgi:hypothetical protein
VNQSEPTGKRRIIFVLGMHRSGTSLTTNVLSELGVALSEDLMPATHENARGYFESQTISFLQDRILAAFGIAWDSPTSMRALPPEWWKSPSIAPLRAQIVAFVNAELDKHPLWAFKDPRTMRHPNEVGGSLHARGKLDPVIAELLWLEHNVDTVLACRDRIAAFVDYQRWIDQPLEQARYMIERAGLPYSGPDEELAAMLARVVAPELRHHAPSNQFHLPFTGPLYDALLKRDLAAALSLSELFNISRTLTSAVAVPMYRKLNELTTLSNQRGARIAQLEAHIKAMQPAPSASIAEPKL